MSKVYDIVTEQIIKKLEKGVVPWHKPWYSYPAVNWVSQKPYRGVNQLLLDGGEYATWNQIKKAGGWVKKGAKSQIITFWKMLKFKEEKEMTNVETGKTEIVEYIEKVPMLRYYRVFNIKDCKGLKPKRKVKKFEHDSIDKAEEIVDKYIDRPMIMHNTSEAYYSPSDDRVSIPHKEQFKDVEKYYSTLFHEFIHSTGHKKRLNRNGVSNVTIFGSKKYSKEELVAEIGSAMLCSMAGIEQVTIDNSTAYIQSWLKALKNDTKMVVFAASQAQKAVEYIKGQYEQQNKAG